MAETQAERIRRIVAAGKAEELLLKAASAMDGDDDEVAVAQARAAEGKYLARVREIMRRTNNRHDPEIAQARAECRAEGGRV